MNNRCRGFPRTRWSYLLYWLHCHTLYCGTCRTIRCC